MNLRLQEEEAGVHIKIPYDKFTARGLVVSTLMMIVLLFFLYHAQPPSFKMRFIQIRSEPLILLSFGDGDGTGGNSGNLTESGEKNKGDTPPTNLHDANIAEATIFDSKANDSQIEIEDAETFIPIKNIKSNKKNEGKANGKGKDNFGVDDGVDWGTGLGSHGKGKGAGYGFGDIDWGGGGNRIVIEKHVPKFPKGVKVSATIKLKFYVHPDGTVGRVIPILRATDPRLDQAAIKAIKKWKFNPLSTNAIMVGIIPLTFVLK